MKNEKKSTELFGRIQAKAGEMTCARGSIPEMYKELDFKQLKTNLFQLGTIVIDSKTLLESTFGLSVNAIAYPNGDCSERDIRMAKEVGYRCGLLVDYG